MSQNLWVKGKIKKYAFATGKDRVRYLKYLIREARKEQIETKSLIYDDWIKKAKQEIIILEDGKK